MKVLKNEYKFPKNKNLAKFPTANPYNNDSEF